MELPNAYYDKQQKAEFEKKWKAAAKKDFEVQSKDKKEKPKKVSYVVDLKEESFNQVETIAQGWTSLSGFMKEEEMLKSLHYQQPPMPVVLPCAFPVGAKLEGPIALKYNGKPVALLHDVEVYEHRKEERAARTFGLTDKRHPYVENFIENTPDSLCGGELETPEPKVKRNDGLDKYRMTPKELRDRFRELNADAVFVFQLRNPIHNGHALLMQDTYRQLKAKGFSKPVLWINPLGGWTKDDDVPLDTRMAQHEALLKNKVFGEELDVVLSIFPSTMYYAGPREVQWHALARQKVGATHYIVGRDPAGMKHPETKDDIYSMWHGQSMLKMNPNFDMQIVTRIMLINLGPNNYILGVTETVFLQSSINLK